MKLLSASKLDRVRECPGSHSLPVVRSVSDASLRGIALHEYVQHRNLEAVPEAYRADAAKLNMERFDERWGDMHQEVGFAYNVNTEECRIRVEPWECDPKTELYARVDLFKDDKVLDMKFGQPDKLPDPATSGQLMLAAECIRGTQTQDIEVGWLLPGFDGQWYEKVFRFDPMDLAAIRQQLKRWHTDAMKKTDKYTQGPWCSFCPGYSACPVKLAFAAEVVPVMNEAMTMVGNNVATPEALTHLAQIVITGEEVIARVKEYLYETAKGTPVPWPGGGYLTWTEGYGKRRVNSKVAIGVIEDQFGPEIADVATTKSVTLGGIREAARVLAKQEGGSIIDAQRAIEGAVESKGGISQKETFTPEIVKRTRE